MGAELSLRAFSSLVFVFLCHAFCLLLISQDLQAMESAPGNCDIKLLPIHVVASSPHIYDLPRLVQKVRKVRYAGPVIARISVPVGPHFFPLQRFLETEAVKAFVPENFKGVQNHKNRPLLAFLAIGGAEDLSGLLSEMYLLWPDLEVRGTIYLHDQEEAQFIFSRTRFKNEGATRYPFVGQIDIEPGLHVPEIPKKEKAQKRYAGKSVQIHWSKEARQRLKYLGTDMEEVELLLQTSGKFSYAKNDKFIVPLFKRIRNEVIFWDEVIVLKTDEKYIPGKTSKINVLEIYSLSAREEKAMYQEIAEQNQVASVVLEAPSLKRISFSKWSLGDKIKISSNVMVKINEKHGVKIEFLKEILKGKPTRSVLSTVAEERLELHYEINGESLVVVLGWNSKENTTSLVTSYFKKLISND